jgi:O-antigen ligase
VLIKPVVGVILLVPAIAFIPTTAAVGLVGFIWFATILNLAMGRVEAQNTLFKGRAATLFMIVVLSGGVLSYTPAQSLASAAVYMVFISTVFLFMILLKNKDLLKAVLALAVSAAAIASLYGIYQYVTGNIEVGWADSEMFEGMKRIYSTFENPNVFGEYLLISIPFAMALFFGSKKTIWKILWLGAGGLMFVALLLTMSRGCWIGLAVGVFIYFAIADRRYLWIFPAAVLVLPFVLPQSVLGRLLSIGNLDDSSSLYRLYIWLGTISMLKDYWPTGVGLGTKAFSGIYSAYAYNGVPAPHAHNLYLQILSETGAAGLLSFAWVSIKAFRNSVSTSFGKERFKKHIGAGLAAALTGFFVQGVFDNVFYNYRIYLLFFITVAITYTYYSVYKKGSDNQIEKN